MINRLKSWYIAVKNYIRENISQEAESLVIWYAICFAFGAGFYLAFPYELPTWLVVVYLEAVLVLLYLTKGNYVKFKCLTYVLAFMLGLCIAKADALYQYKKIEHNLPQTLYLRGRIEDTTHTDSNRYRITLTDVNDFEKDLKGKFSISYPNDDIFFSVGTCVELVASFPNTFSNNPLSAYNYKESLFYKGISGTGYSISPILKIKCDTKAQKGIKSYINNLRADIKETIKKNVQTNAASIISAITIGDKKDITKEQYDNFRTSGLAHFLAISGMHMGMITLLFYVLFYRLCSSFTYDIKKPALLTGLIFAFAYFLISGQSVSCVRAFIMTFLILLAGIFKREAISLRMWAFALTLIVLVTPNAVTTPAFLMSFSATLGLIAYYEANKKRISSYFMVPNIFTKIRNYMVAVLLTDLIASLMTLPYTVYFFKQFSVYTTLGNFLAAPVIAFLIMPSLLLFLITLITGGEIYSLKLLEFSINILQEITKFVTNLNGAKYGYDIVGMSSATLLLITCSLLWICIWQRKWRYWGIVGLVVAGINFISMPKADFVFNDKGDTYAYRDTTGKLSISRYNHNKFLERLWTGTHKKKSEILASEDKSLIKCNQEGCVYKDIIEFGKHQIKYKGKEISPQKGGFIDIKRGVYYSPVLKNRLWDK